MSGSDANRLNDIRRMCQIVAETVVRGRAALDEDEARWLGVERCIEIAGEAATHVSQGTRERFPAVAWKELVASRVLLAHAYHRVDREQLWVIAVRDLPEVARALGPLDGPS